MTTTDRACAVTGGLTGLVVALLVGSVGLLYLDNTYGPLEEHPTLGTFTALTAAALAGGPVFLLGRWLGHRMPFLLLALVVLVGASAWVLVPRRVDVSESFVPRPNPRWSCTGWSLRHYPPGVSDASEETYCVGWEKRISDG